MLITKRDGSKVPLDLDKIHRVTAWAVEDLDGVSESQLQLNARLKFYPGMKTSDIQETLIKSAAELISEDNPNYQYVAGRLIQYDLYKKVFGSPTPTPLYDHVVNVVSDGYYTNELLDWYTPEEWDELNAYIKHERDMDIAYAGMDVFREKYLVRNRQTKQLYETPQIAFMMIAATFFHRYLGKARMDYVKEFYDAASTFVISLPTPIMCGLRTPEKQFSSCVLIETDDSLDSIAATSSAIIKYIAKRAGIGIGAGSLRGAGAAVRNGDTTHTGNFSFYRLFESAVSSCSQGGVRKGSGNLNYVGWHYEFEDMLVLKNNKGTPDSRLPGLDYTVQLNKLFYERLIEGGNISFFSPSEVPGLYQAFFENTRRFKTLYEKYERNTKIRRKTMKATEFFTKLMQERKDTGRIYIMNVDHANDHGAFIPELAAIRMTNLCVEVMLPTKPLDDLKDTLGEIALCTLAAVNWGRCKSIKDFERASILLVRALDELLDFQDYPVIAGRNGAVKRRPLGIGVVGFAHWMARQGLRYQDIDEEGLAEIDRWAQWFSYYLIKASVDLAKEKGACELVNETKYAKGILPVDTYKKEVDQLTPHIDHAPWPQIREELLTWGIRNSTLMAGMPGETSTLASGTTNGFEPPPAPITVKGNKDSLVKVVVPEIKRLKNKYDYRWVQKSPRGYLKIIAIFQKYFDQSISGNTTYNPAFWEKDEIPMTELIGDLLFAYLYGLKSLYYFNTADGAGEIEIQDEEDCEACKL